MAKILCLVDSYNWALANRAKNLKKVLKNHSLIIEHFNKVRDINFNKFDIVYSLNWPIHGYIKGKIKKNRRYRLVTTISSHIGRGHARTLSGLLKQYDAISTSNNFLFKEFSPVYKDKVFNTPFGVNSKLFIPKTKPEYYHNIFGWVGNHTRDVKRFRVIENIFKKLGQNYILKTAKVGDGLTRTQMVEFYNSIGTVICFSTSEGTPNPILEGASCGRSIISTSVGNVPELVGARKSISIVKDSSQLKRAIVSVANNRAGLASDGAYLRSQIEESWSWNKRAKAFIPFLGMTHV